MLFFGKYPYLRIPVQVVRDTPGVMLLYFIVVCLSRRYFTQIIISYLSV